MAHLGSLTDINCEKRCGHNVLRTNEGASEVGIYLTFSNTIIPIRSIISNVLVEEWRRRTPFRLQIRNE